MRGRPLTVFIGFFLALVSYGVVHAQPAEPSPDAETSALLRQHRDVLAERLGLLERRYATGMMSFDSLLSAKDQLLASELRLAVTPEERISLYKKRLENLRAWEGTMNQMHEMGQCEMDQVLLVKASRLKAEIELLRERSQGRTSDDASVPMK